MGKNHNEASTTMTPVKHYFNAKVTFSGRVLCSIAEILTKEKTVARIVLKTELK
jgi:hypothetical protein